MRRLHGRDGVERGQALVEFAFTFPLLLVLLFAVIDFGRVSFTYMSLASGTAEMARQLSIPATSNAAAIAAFTNGNVAMAGTDRVNDKVTMTVVDVNGLPQGTPTICFLPLRPSTCTVPPRVDATGAPYLGGYVVVNATSTFVFMPRLSGPLGTGYWEPSAALQAMTRAYIG